MQFEGVSVVSAARVPHRASERAAGVADVDRRWFDNDLPGGDIPVRPDRGLVEQDTLTGVSVPEHPGSHVEPAAGVFDAVSAEDELGACVERCIDARRPFRYSEIREDIPRRDLGEAHGNDPFARLDVGAPCQGGAPTARDPVGGAFGFQAAVPVADFDVEIDIADLADSSARRITERDIPVPEFQGKTCPSLRPRHVAEHAVERLHRNRDFGEAACRRCRCRPDFDRIGCFRDSGGDPLRR